MARTTCNSLFLIESFYLGESKVMLKKRIFVATIALGLSISSAQAAPLSWTPGPALLAELGRFLDFLPAVHHRPFARSARDASKNGCGMDPNGVMLCGQGMGPTAPPAPRGGK
jgi:hypothetical protein